MKWLGAGVIFVNLSTVCGLLLGMIAGGLNPPVAAVSILFGGAIALYLIASESSKVRALEPPQPKATASGLKASTGRSFAFARYRDFWKWALAACFAVFAFRCFCWLLYIDGDELRIQSPNNLGDLALHITHIKYFANGVPLWPANPIYVFSEHLRYPAGADLFNALLSCLGVDLIRGLVWAGLLASVGTFYAFYRWGGSFAVAGFLFNGGIAGFQFLNNLKFLDYQGDKSIAWKSLPLTMFVTQRGLLYAIPAGLLLLWNWREKYFRGMTVAAAIAPGTHGDRLQQPLPFWVELSIYASMPLFHVHTFFALTIVLVFLFVFQSLDEIKLLVDLIRKGEGARIGSIISSPAKWRELFPYAHMRAFVLLAAAFVPATFFIWLITDHFKAGSVFEWHPGWVQDDPELAAPFFKIAAVNFSAATPVFDWLLQKIWTGVLAPVLQFWLPNFGILIPLVLTLLGAHGWRVWKTETRRRQKLREETVLLWPAVAIFILAFFVKMAPWGWDNLKIMIWAYFLVLPFLWTRLIARWPAPMRVAVCILLFGSGFVSLLGGLSAGRPGFGFVNRAELDGVGVAVRRLPVGARFAAYPIYNHPLLLQGRKVALGYPGHLWTQGFENYGQSEQLLRQFMEGGAKWHDLARVLRVRYVFWGREEKANYPKSTRPWEHSAALVAFGGWGAIYDLEQPPRSPPPR